MSVRITAYDLHIGQEVYQLSGGIVTPFYVSEIKRNDPCSTLNRECMLKSYKLSFQRDPLYKDKVYKGYHPGAFADIDDTVAISEYNDRFYFNLSEVQEAQKAFRQRMYDLGMQALQDKAKELASYQAELSKPLFGEEVVGSEISGKK